MDPERMSVTTGYLLSRVHTPTTLTNAPTPALPETRAFAVSVRFRGCRRGLLLGVAVGLDRRFRLVLRLFGIGVGLVGTRSEELRGIDHSTAGIGDGGRLDDGGDRQAAAHIGEHGG